MRFCTSTNSDFLEWFKKKVKKYSILSIPSISDQVKRLSIKAVCSPPSTNDIFLKLSRTHSINQLAFSSF